MHKPKFLAGRIHQMRGGKSYLVGQVDWQSKDQRRRCSRCELEEETVEHIMKRCPVIDINWRRIDPEVRDFGADTVMFKPTKQGKEAITKFVDLISLHKVNFPVVGELPHTRISQLLS